MPPLTDEERADLEKLAERDDLRSSEWARRLLDAADRVYGDSDG